MTIFDNFLQRLGYVKAKNAAQYPEFLRVSAGVERTSYPNYALPKAQSELYQRLSWINTAISIVSNSAAAVELSVFESEEEQDKELINHPFELLIQRPNPLQSRFEFLRNTFINYLLTGNAYWWLNRPGENSPPSEIWLLPSSSVQPVPDERLFLLGYDYDPGNGALIRLQPWEILHLRDFNPYSLFIGLSKIEAIAQTAINDMAQVVWTATQYKGTAKLPGVLAFADPIPDPEWAQLREEVRLGAKSDTLLMMRNVGKGGVELIQNTMGNRQMQFLETRKFNREEIFDIFAPGLVSVLSENATEANARTGKATLIEMAIWPMLCLLAEKITNDILPAYGQYLRAMFEDIRPMDRALRLSEIAEYSKTHTIDEVRLEYYSDTAIGDERGRMLPTQIGASPVGILTPTSSPPAQAPQQPPEIEPPTVAKAIQQDTRENLSEPVKTALEKWERKALKSLQAGKSPDVEFVSDAIPRDVIRRISLALKSCTTAEEIKAAFDAVAKPRQDNQPLHDAFLALASEIKMARNALRET